MYEEYFSEYNRYIAGNDDNDTTGEDFLSTFQTQTPLSQLTLLVYESKEA